ncbi:MAG: GAF domain-containing protein [Chloroflexi bacterium]|nr:GAF domain-containing protein [Chloroflexota bacterium]
MPVSLSQRFPFNQLKTVRGRLIFGLLPGLVALITLLVIGLLATDILVRANNHLADTGWELAATRMLQFRLQQTLIPLTDALAHHDPDSGVKFLQMADNLDRVFDEVRPHYGETEEQVLFAEIEKEWRQLRADAERLLAEPSPETTAQGELAIRTTTDFIFQRLELLNDAVYGEMLRTVSNSQTAHDTASALLIGSTLIAFLLGVFFVWLFPHYITRPLVDLREGAAKIGSGDLTYRLKLDRKDEIGELAHEFNLMAARLRDSYQHLEDRVAERTEQLWALNEASRSVVGELHLERVLQTIADLARNLGGAQYAAVLVPRREGDAPPRFIVSPSTLATDRSTMPFPSGRDLLAVLLQTTKPLRAKDLSSQPLINGFPVGHPAMQNFLGIPIRVHGHTIGGLYLTNKPQSASFTDENEQILSMLAAYAGIAIENARLYKELKEMNEVLERRVRERTAELEAVSAERAQYAVTLRQVLNRNVQIQEAERQRIANGIHDGVSQWLMGALFELQAAKVRLPLDAVEVQYHLQAAQQVLKDVKEEMRRVIYDLHPPLLESNGLVTALRNHVQELESHSHLTIPFEVEGEPVRLPSLQELALFRIGQEALTNVLKHAGSKVAQVRLSFSDKNVTLRVVDEGEGFAVDALAQVGRAQLGLLSMQERAAAVGGILDIESSFGQGTCVRVTVPIQQAFLTPSSQPPATSV